MGTRLVVIGGNAAGMTAASQARRRRGPSDLAITAFERGRFTSYSSCGIPYLVGGTVDLLERLIVRSPDVFMNRDSIEVRTATQIEGIDVDAQKVWWRNVEDGSNGTEPFDMLVLAVGAKPIRPPLEGVDAAGIYGVQTLDDGVAIDRAVTERQPRHAVVVGGGYIGLEMAEAFISRGIETALVEAGPEPMATLDPEMGALVADAMRAAGIAVYTDDPVAGFDASDGRVEAVVTDSQTLPADIVVLGLGVAPDVDLAQAAGIALGPSGAIAVDRRMRTGTDGVWAAGDCVEKWHRVAREPAAMPLGTHANKEGRVAGINLSGGYATFPGIIGTATSKICSVEVARTGLNEYEAAAAGFESLAVTVDSTTRAGYFPETRPIKTKMVVERNSARVLGAQIIGEEGAAKRIDVIATMVWNEMTADEALNVDLSYAPPFAPLWDPVLITARKAWQAVQDELAGS